MIVIQVLLLSTQWHQRARLDVCLPSPVARLGFLWRSPLPEAFAFAWPFLTP